MFGRLRPFQAAQSLLERFQSSSGTSPAFRSLVTVEQPISSVVCRLSEDLFYLIFAMLDPEDLMTCAQVGVTHSYNHYIVCSSPICHSLQVCRILSHLVRNDLRSQYRIELAISGMVDGTQVDMPLTEKLDKLRDYRKRSRACPTLLTSDLRGATSSQVQVMVSDGALIHCVRKLEGYDVDIRPADGSAPRQFVISSDNTFHVEAADLSQELLIASERAERSSYA